jgi:hypothetical protein
MLKLEEVPNWILYLEQEDITFLKKFVISSGSLKEMAKEYEVTYPTLRLRLDKIIEKVNVGDNQRDDAFIEKIKSLAIDDKIELPVAKEIINEYRRIKK